MIRPLIKLNQNEARVFVDAMRSVGFDIGEEPSFLARALSGRRVHMSASEAAVFLQGLTAVNELQMGEVGGGRPRVRNLIQSGRLRYSREDANEEWKSFRDILRELACHGIASGDCEDLACLWAAESRVDGWDSLAHPTIYPVNPRLSHVVVRLPGYEAREGAPFVFVDPSRLAGMGKE